MKKRKYKKAKTSITEHLYTAAVVIISILFVVMLVTFYQNIILKTKRNELSQYLEEYKQLKKEIDGLTEIKENYEIILKNNEELKTEKKELKNKITELNKQISNLNRKIDELK